MRRICTLFLLGALGGCATVPEASSERPIAQGQAVAGTVELCKTTVASLQERLGEPSRDGRLGRQRILTWVVAWDPLVKYLGVMADDKGLVVDLYWDLPSEIQWTPVNRCR